MKEQPLTKQKTVLIEEFEKKFFVQNGNTPINEYVAIKAFLSEALDQIALTAREEERKETIRQIAKIIDDEPFNDKEQPIDAQSWYYMSLYKKIQSLLRTHLKEKQK